MKTYSDFYQQCIKEHTSLNERSGLYDFKYAVQNPHEDGFLKLSKEYYKNIDIISEHIKSTITNKESQIKTSSSIEKEPIIRYKNVWSIPKLEEVCQEILPQIESNIFKSYVYLYGLYTYRNQPCEEEPRASWLWHYDNHPKEVLKMMIYLTDTHEDTGCFEILTDKSGEAIKKETLRIDHKSWQSNHSRVVGKELEDYMKAGSKIKKITGNKGTICLFDNNIIHRASTAKRGYRDAIVLMFRPWNKKIRPYISKDYTGSNNHRDVFKNPEFFGAKKK